jgi:hypothetical protein
VLITLIHIQSHASTTENTNQYTEEKNEYEKG